MRGLLVDLNNYARFPTLAIGYLVASLRREGIEVEVLSPLAYGLPAPSASARRPSGTSSSGGSTSAPIRPC